MKAFYKINPHLKIFFHSYNLQNKSYFVLGGLYYLFKSLYSQSHQKRSLLLFHEMSLIESLGVLTWLWEMRLSTNPWHNPIRGW